MKVPRKAGCAAEVSKAMPGIMRPLMQMNMLLDTTSTAAMGTTGPGHKVGNRVTPNSGTIKAQAMYWKVRALPSRSLMRPTQRATSSAPTPPKR